MAFSMFLRNAAGCPRFSLQIGARAVLLPKQCESISISTSTKNNTTPLLNSIRQFRTSQVHNSLVGDHSKLWVAERALSVALLPLIPMALMFPCKILDYSLAIAVVAHTFWGFEAIAVDYARPAVIGTVLSKAALGLVYVLCIATLGGLFYIINHDVGLANTIRNIWSVKAKQA